MPTICYYISGHGLGHASRATQIIAHLHSSVQVIVKSHASSEFLKRECGRDVEIVSQKLDVGVVQLNNRELDWERTFADAARMMDESTGFIAREIDFLRERKVDLVVTDVPPLPLCAAKQIGIPAVLIANFTWVDIYRPHAQSNPAVASLVIDLERAYRCADLVFAPRLAFPMEYLQNKKQVNLVARQGKSLRNELIEHLNVPATQRLVLLYFGNWGDDDLNASGARFIPGTTFVAFTDIEPLARKLDPQQWRFPDVLSSVDAVIAKPGYGTVGECMANGTPLVYYPRSEFAEYEVIREALHAWGGAIEMSLPDFERGQWQAAIDAAVSLSSAKVRCDGATQIAAAIHGLLNVPE